MFYKQVHTHVRTSPSGSTMQARFPFHAFTGLCFYGFFVMVFDLFFSVVFWRSWACPRRFWTPTWPPLGGQDGSKIAPRWSWRRLTCPKWMSSNSLCFTILLALGGVPRRVKIVFKAILFTSPCMSIFASFLNTSWSSQKVTWSATWAPQEGPEGRSGVAKLRSEIDKKSCFSTTRIFTIL